MKKDILPILETLHSHTKAPVTFLDIESTGLEMAEDEIIQIYLCKFDGLNFVEHKANYNVDAEISKGAFDKHGLTKEDLVGLPYFAEDANMIYDTYLAPGTILCGFNSNQFDLPFIIEKMLQVKLVKAISITKNKTIDVIQLYRELYPGTLEGIHERLIGCELEGSHDAKEDINGTIRILDKLLELHPNLTMINQSDTIDAGGFFKREDNAIIFAKGKKVIGQNVLTMDAKEAKGFLGWICNTTNISIHSRTIARKLIDKIDSLALAKVN